MKTRITSNILEGISKRFEVDNYSISDNKALIVFTGSDIILDKYISEIQRLRKNGIQVSIAFSFMAEGLLDTQGIIDSICPINIYWEMDVFKLRSILREHSILIGPNVTINTLSKVSLGLIDSFIPNLIWTFLYQGKNVYLDFESVRNYLGTETENVELLNQINNHIDTLKKMGVIEVSIENLLYDIVINPELKTKKFNELVDYTRFKNNENRKKVIIEKDILDLNSNEILTLPKGTIITHLARDKAKERNIKIEIV